MVACLSLELSICTRSSGLQHYPEPIEPKCGWRNWNRRILELMTLAIVYSIRSGDVGGIPGTLPLDLYTEYSL